VARSFDYSAPAELFAPKGRPGMRQPVAYRRFPSAAARHPLRRGRAVSSGTCRCHPRG
jgi:hypothetical protein